MDLPGLDFVSLAAGMGCPGRRVVRADELRRTLDDAFRTDGPSLIDVAVDPAIPQLYGG
jgi:benzoylformate decarboxylase